MLYKNNFTAPLASKSCRDLENLATIYHVYRTLIISVLYYAVDIIYVDSIWMMLHCSVLLWCEQIIYIALRVDKRVKRVSNSTIQCHAFKSSLEIQSITPYVLYYCLTRCYHNCYTKSMSGDLCTSKTAFRLLRYSLFSSLLCTSS